MSALTIEIQPTGPVVFPTAGVGGSIYDTPFPVPVYANSPNNLATWRMLDTWNTIQLNSATTQGIATGLVWATLTYLLALTPTRKRSTAFHSFLLMGLVFLLIHFMVKLISALTPGLQPLSAYTFVTFDIVDSVWTTKFIATYAASEVTVWFAFAFATVCLWLQAKTLMTGLKGRYPGLYKSVLLYLVVTSLTALAGTMANSIYQTMELGVPTSQTQRAITKSYQVRVGYLIACALCLGSFSLVSMVSVVYIVWKRPASVITGNSAYASALNLIGLLCAQSFVIPFIFCILQIVPSQTGLMDPQAILLPTIYMILPLGSLFMTVNSDARTNTDEVEFPIRTPPYAENNNMPPSQSAYTNSDMTLTNSNGSPARTGPRPSCSNMQGAYIDRELSSIDAMECGASEVGVEKKELAAETEAMLTNKDAEEKEVVVSVSEKALA